MGVIKNIDRKAWHVTVVSPDNYFLFQPLLPSATVGTVEVRTLVEPLRKILARVHGHFLQAKAVDLDMELQLVEVAGVGGGENFYLPVRPLFLFLRSLLMTCAVRPPHHRRRILNSDSRRTRSLQLFPAQNHLGRSSDPTPRDGQPRARCSSQHVARGA